MIHSGHVTMPEHPGVKRDIGTLRARIRWLADTITGLGQTVAQLVQDMTTEKARISHVAGGATSIGLIVGGTQSGIVVTWPGTGFPSDAYAVETVPLAYGMTAVTVTSQTATTVTVSVTAGLALSIGAAFLVYGRT